MVDWTVVKFFKPTEFGQYADEMDAQLIYRIDKLRVQANRPIRINDHFRPGDKGQHGLGKAVDIVIMGMSLLDQYLLAEKSGLFTGIGLYPYWNTPGIHLDVRDVKLGEPGARWGRNAAGVYVALNAKFIQECVGK